MQTFQLLAAKTLTPPETDEAPTQPLSVHNQPETKGSVINALNTLAFPTRETH